jgi:hypothetical protein
MCVVNKGLPACCDLGPAIGFSTGTPEVQSCFWHMYIMLAALCCSCLGHAATWVLMHRVCEQHRNVLLRGCTPI